MANIRKSLTFKPQERRQRRIHLVRSDRSALRATGFVESRCAAVVAVGSGYLTEDCVEACRRQVRRALKKAAKLRICLNPFLPLTAKPAEVRMGKGKGKIRDHVYPVLPGKVIFEVSGVTAVKGRSALLRTQGKIPIRTRVVVLRDRD